MQKQNSDSKSNFLEINFWWWKRSLTKPDAEIYDKDPLFHQNCYFSKFLVTRFFLLKVFWSGHLLSDKTLNRGKIIFRLSNSREYPSLTARNLLLFNIRKNPERIREPVIRSMSTDYQLIVFIILFLKIFKKF